MRSMIIDPFEQKVYEKDLPDSNSDTLKGEIGVDSLTTTSLGSGVFGVLDDLGLYRVGQRYWYFDHPNGRVMMAGKAILLSVDEEGETQSLDWRAAVATTEPLIVWIGDARAAEEAIQAGKLRRPAIEFDGVPVWQWTPASEGNIP